jgi:hypothetical protein
MLSPISARSLPIIRGHDPVFLHPPDKGMAGNPEKTGGGTLIPVVPFKSLNSDFLISKTAF